MAEENSTVIGTILRNGGGAAAGAVAGAAVVAPLAIWGLGIVLAPFTGGLSVAAAAAVTATAVVGTAVIAHEKSKNVQ